MSVPFVREYSFVYRHGWFTEETEERVGFGLCYRDTQVTLDLPSNISRFSLRVSYPAQEGDRLLVLWFTEDGWQWCPEEEYRDSDAPVWGDFLSPTEEEISSLLQDEWDRLSSAEGHPLIIGLKVINAE